MADVVGDHKAIVSRRWIERSHRDTTQIYGEIKAVSSALKPASFQSIPFPFKFSQPMNQDGRELRAKRGQKMLLWKGATMQDIISMQKQSGAGAP